jgi:hypothetical protein
VGGSRSEPSFRQQDETLTEKRPNESKKGWRYGSREILLSKYKALYHTHKITVASCEFNFIRKTRPIAMENQRIASKLHDSVSVQEAAAGFLT